MIKVFGIMEVYVRRMYESFKEKIKRADRGKEVFRNMFRIDDLSLEDAFLLVLTNNRECIEYGVRYLPNFIKQYRKRNVYVLSDNVKNIESFSYVGGKVKICKSTELSDLAAYFNVVVKKEFSDTRIIFLTEKDGYGLYVEELLEKKEFSLEEYVAISLYQLKGVKGETI